MLFRLIKATVIIGLSSLIGCTPAPTTTAIQAQHHEHELCRISVLPFANDSDKPRLGQIAKKICQAELLHRNAPVVNEADIRVFLQKRRIFASELTNYGGRELFVAMAQELQTQGIIKGRILAIEQEKTQGEILPVITLQLELLNASDGKLVVSSFLRRSGEDYRTIMHYGAVRTQTELLQRIIAEIFNDWTSRGVLNCQKLS